VLAGTVAVGAVACDDDGGSASPKLPDGVDVEEGGLPEGFPEDGIPLPRAPISTGAAVGSGSEQNWTLVYGVDAVRRNADRYRQQLERAGFTVEQSFSTDDEAGDLTSFTATRDDYIVTVFAGGIDRENALTVTVAPAAIAVP